MNLPPNGCVAETLDCYEVGGAVRDALLGRPVSDRDWVVVGATPERMTALGFQPVGRDFPVFLHPVTHEEYALARTERKSGRGYRGFVVQCAPDVTLEEDLRRRDLTINAMARARDGRLVDPWGGVQDLHAGVLRHVSEAFAEDPVRILRVARFAARFHGFSIAPVTESLMRAMVAAGEVDALVPERVWQELARGLMEPAPSRMIAVLHDCGALGRLLPELDEHWGASLARTVDAAARRGLGLEERFAVLLHPMAPDAVARTCARLRAPRDCRDLARLAADEHPRVARALDLDAGQSLALLERCDAIRKPDRFERLLQVCELAQAHGQAGADPWAPACRLREALRQARAVDAGAIAATVADGDDASLRSARIKAAVHAARERAVGQALGSERCG